MVSESSESGGLIVSLFFCTISSGARSSMMWLHQTVKHKSRCDWLCLPVSAAHLSVSGDFKGILYQFWNDYLFTNIHHFRQGRFKNQRNSRGNRLLHTSGEWNAAQLDRASSDAYWNRRSYNSMHPSNLLRHARGEYCNGIKCIFHLFRNFN